jgi:hypothetical protein
VAGSASTVVELGESVEGTTKLESPGFLEIFTLQADFSFTELIERHTVKKRGSMYDMTDILPGGMYIINAG